MLLYCIFIWYLYTDIYLNWFNCQYNVCLLRQLPNTNINFAANFRPIFILFFYCDLNQFLEVFRGVGQSHRSLWTKNSQAVGPTNTTTGWKVELSRQPSRLLANILRRGAARPLSSHSEMINLVRASLVKFKPQLLARCQTLLPDVLLRSEIEFSERKKKTGFNFCSKSPSLTHNSKKK